MRIKAGAAFGGLLLTVYLALFYAPTEKTMGLAQRIFYIHVPSAWVAFLAFLIVFISSIMYLRKKDREWDIYALSAAEVGVFFCTLVLVTGPFWGRSAWGAWWVWDVRLTTTLVLWLIYVAYLMLRAYVPDEARRARFAAVLGIVGFIDVPIVYLSIVLLRTHHPSPVVSRRGGLAELPVPMHVVLWTALASFILLFIYLFTQRVALERLRDEVAWLKARKREE